MIAFIIGVFIILPPAVWLLGYCNLDPEAEDQTMEEAKAEFRYRLLHYGGFWFWLIGCSIMWLIFSGWATKILKSLHGG